MSELRDPFDALRSSAGDPVPDIGEIKARAGAIQRRRSVALVTGAAAVAIIAVAGVVLRPGPPTSTVATDTTRTSTQAPEAFSNEQRAVAGTQAATPTPALGAGTAGSAGTAAGAEADSADMKSQPASAPKAAGLEATVAVKEGTVTQRGAEFTLRVCNKTDLTVEYGFGSAKRYDFEVSRDGEVVWTWSDGRVFTQAVGRETWKPKECKSWTERWDGMRTSGGLASSGEHTVVGILATYKPLKTEPATFCLDLC